MRCTLCGSEIEKPRFAIREYEGRETYIQWVLRHVKYLLTRGFRKYVPWHLPVCEGCVRAKLNNEDG